jgi:hypothetical protein
MRSTNTHSHLNHNTFRFLQVLSKAKEDEPLGWWPATAKMFKGDFFVVDYKVSAQGASYSDIVPSDKIRCPNTKYIRRKKTQI